MAKNHDRDSESARNTIRSMICVVCKSSPCHAHHIKTRGAGGHDFIKGDRGLCLNLCPLCVTHHAEIHTVGVETFKAKYKAFKEYLTDIGHPLK